MRVLKYHIGEAQEQQKDALRQLRDSHYDILHIYGCWDFHAWRLARQALKHGTRLILSPQGQLEPWVIKDGYWNEKLPKKMLYQKWIVKNAYAVIVQGKMEEKCLQQLDWNPRLLIIRNPQITNSITQEEADRQTATLYQKVMDSNTLDLMSVQTRQMLKLFLKAGITSDARWVTEDLITLGQEEWRQLLCYAHQEHLTEILKHGARVLNYEVPNINAADFDFYVPENYHEVTTIEKNIGLSFVSENQRLMATFKHLKKLWQQRRIAISHLVELDKELRFHDIDEGKLQERLMEQRLLKLAGRFMQLMNDLTGLTEGFMPVPPVNDRITRQMKRQVEEHLKI